jgi:Carboxypeptidase regulatory-like domain
MSTLKFCSLPPSTRRETCVRRAFQSALAVFCLSLAVLTPCAGQQNSSIRVTVIDDRGAAVLGAEVRILGLPTLVGTPAPNGTVSFKGVPPGTYQISTKYRGFRDKVVAGVVVVEGKPIELAIKLEPAPPKASDYRIHQELLDAAHFYSKLLTDIEQPLLCSESISDSTERYRFLWVPTFEHPILLRIDIDPDGTATLLSYIWKGQGGYEWGKSERNRRKLTSEEEMDLFGTLADIGFWSLPAQVENPPNLIVLDGTEWFIEGVRDGGCHVVSRYSSPLTELFEQQFLARVAKLSPYYTPDR